MHPQTDELMGLLQACDWGRKPLRPSEAKQILRALTRIGRLGGESDMVALAARAHWFTGPLVHGELNRAWVSALERLLGRLEADRIPAAGRRLRVSYDGRGRSQWSQGQLKWHHAEAALYSMNWNGYLRQEALQVLREGVRSGRHVDFALPFLLARVHDWVNPVAEIGRTTFLEALPEASPAALLRILPLLNRADTPRRDRQGRAFQAEVAGAVSARLREADGTAILRDGLAARSGAVRSACAIELLARGAEGAHEELLDHPDESIRLRYLSRMREGQPTPGQTARLLRLSEDPSPAVRAAALRALAAAQEGGGDWARHRDRFRAALLDKARHVRGIAQFHCRRQEPEVSIPDAYRDTICERREGWLAAVDGLSQLPHTEQERQADDAVFHALADEAAPDVAGGVVVARALVARAELERSRLGGGETPDPQLVEWLFSFLGDPRLAVRSAASKALAALGCAPAPDRLVALACDVLAMGNGQERPDLRTELMPLLRVARGLDDWPRITFLLGLPLEHDPALRERAEAELHRWVNQVGNVIRCVDPWTGKRFEPLRAADVETALYVEGRAQDLSGVLDGGLVEGIRAALVPSRRA